MATLLIEITDQGELKRRLPQLVGIEDAVSIRIGSVVVQGRGEEGRSTDVTTSSVHYLRFAVPPEAAATLEDTGVQAHVVIDHPAYQAWTEVSPDLRRELLRIPAGLEGEPYRSSFFGHQRSPFLRRRALW